MIGILDTEDDDSLCDPDLTAQAAGYLHVIEKMLEEWLRIRATEPTVAELISYRDRLAARIQRLGDDVGTRGGFLAELDGFYQAVDRVVSMLEGRVVSLGGDETEASLYGHLKELLELFDRKIGIVKLDVGDRERMIHQVSIMYARTLMRKGECAVLAGEHGYEGLITIPFRNLLSREVDDPDSPLNVLRGSRVTAILPDDNGKFRRNFVSSWVSPNERVFVTVGGVEDTEARESVLALVHDITTDLKELGFSGEKYRLDISTDHDTLEDLIGEVIQRIPKPDEVHGSIGIESMAPVWEKIAEVCGVLGFHSKRDESLRHLGSIRGRRFVIEIDRLKRQMDAIAAEADWHADPAKLEEFQGLQKEMMALIERRRRR
ncbi:MAG: hypothetical protein JRG91_09000 [Deltaproteobacteria bacterium]|nr:hypothetical protein [Deltaproteobacteria bacterium]